MCDYSLHNVASRRAKIGDKLISTRFEGTITRGFTAADDPATAVCLLPGTELVFDGDVEYVRPYGRLMFWRPPAKAGHNVARFRQLEPAQPYLHRDALEFPDGKIVMVTRLQSGQRATVIQLPARALPAKAPITIDAEPLTT